MNPAHLGVRLAMAVFVGTTAAQAQHKTTAVIPPWCSVAWHAPRNAMSWEGPRATSGGRTFRGGRELEAIDVRTGKRVAAARAAGPWLEPLASGGLVFACHVDGSVHAFVPQLDRELWQVALPRGRHPGAAVGDIFVVAAGTEVIAITGGKIHWHAELEAAVTTTPASDGKRVFVGTATGRILAIELASGKVAWERDIGTDLGWSTPAVDRGTLFLADRGIRDRRRGALNALSAENGELQWQTDFGATGFSRPFATEHDVWAGFGTCVARFDRTTGTLDREHRIPTGRNAFGDPGVVGDAIVFGNLDGSLYVHDVANGALRWRFEVGNAQDEQQVGSWCLHDGVLVVGTTKGLFGLCASTDDPPADRVVRAPSTK